MAVFTECQINKIVIFRSINKRKHSIDRELSKSVPSLVLGTCGGSWDTFMQRRTKNYPEGEFCCFCYFLLRLSLKCPFLENISPLT